ncbi:Hypothetical predicted protein [Cloeon dipterum]|uniref:RRM domain-containing protein n=1 Tax=Cloeon dipterum TaxID=197152 RepID=A0A8S1C4P4_9INSE|nr:Hypothetical predicted protein [Cloeon dipterum]
MSLKEKTQKKRPSGFLAGLRKPVEPAPKPKKRKIDPAKLDGKQLWQSRRKKGRLIVRNLPFQITEDKLREHFEKFGKVIDTVLLRRNDGKLVGCGFVEFENKENAKTALEECSGKPLMKRPIVVDWALPKANFQHSQKNAGAEIKEEVESSEGEEDDVKPSKPTVNEVKKDTSDSEEDSSNDDRDAEDSEEDDNQFDEQDEEDSEGGDEREDKVIYRDNPEDGKTVFLKCVPFSATEDDLRDCLDKFGPVQYVAICMDANTMHSRGSAFVKFKTRESADKCLQAGASDLRVGTGVLDPHPALNKKNLQQKMEDKKEDKVKNDGRNLYLIKEGVILAGSTAAKGVSAEDMSYRLRLEQSKSQMLRNLSMVISPLRLAVHNLPDNYSDQSLRNAFKKHAPAGSKITEAKIMRDLKKVDSKGQGVSKGYGFVSFTNHEDALSALRAVNNNPNIFTPKKRPIVSFSIENKALLNARQKRLEVSKYKNPNFLKKLKDSSDEKKAGRNEIRRVQPGQGEAFVGIEAHKKQKVKLPTNKTLKAQSDLHRKSISTEKKQLKRLNESKKQKKERLKKRMEPKSKNRVIGEKDDKAFDVMVSKYKSMITDKDSKKWYE